MGLRPTLKGHRLNCPLHSYFHTQRLVYLPTLFRELPFSKDSNGCRDPSQVNIERIRNCEMLSMKWDIFITLPLRPRNLCRRWYRKTARSRSSDVCNELLAKHDTTFTCELTLAVTTCARCMQDQAR